MYTILEKRVLAENIYLMRIHAPRVARAAKPGQFIIVRIDEAVGRQGMYRTQEERARAIEQERENGHKCRVGLDK